MTLLGGYEVGVRELHDRLSEHLERVQAGSEITVTRRGLPIARLTAIADEPDHLRQLVQEGLVTPPAAAKVDPPRRVMADGPVADLIAEQRR